MEVTPTRVTMSLTVRFRSNGNKISTSDQNECREYGLPGRGWLCGIEAQ